MASARLKIEVDGEPHELYFGMAATRIFQERLGKEHLRLQESGIKEPTDSDYDINKVFAWIIHAGLCNMADITDSQRPDFIDSYEISEEIYRDPDSVNKIQSAWDNSRPVKDMVDRLQTLVDAQKKNKVKTTGKKSKPSPSDS